jgi:peroxiredoxin
VLSDIDNGYALMLSLAFYVGDEKKEVMKAAGWNIPPYNANDNWTLPIPATFVVGSDGIVKARHLDPDYRKRMDVELILTAVEDLKGS